MNPKSISLTFIPPSHIHFIFLSIHHITLHYTTSALNSPYISTIQHLWDYVSRAIHNRIKPPRNVQELTVTEEENWNNIPYHKNINKLIISLRRLVLTLLRNREGSNKCVLVRFYVSEKQIIWNYFIFYLFLCFQLLT